MGGRESMVGRGLLEKVCLEFRIEESESVDGESDGDGALAGRPRRVE